MVHDEPRRADPSPGMAEFVSRSKPILLGHRLAPRSTNLGYQPVCGPVCQTQVSGRLGRFRVACRSLLRDPFWIAIDTLVSSQLHPSLHPRVRWPVRTCVDDFHYHGRLAVQKN